MLKAKVMTTGSFIGAFVGAASAAYAAHQFGGDVLYFSGDSGLQATASAYYGLMGVLPGMAIGNSITKAILKLGYNTSFSENPNNLITGI